ncbi:uncharacterized protein LOC101236692 [Hydra vulgaris]|uniref:uncharacterized protein LOC101236692 n=1 Tax=Hydra vulgaris TaxID=6087 RepID=UPI0002B40F70|nr:uncharacterized protein LOC101236692 [Hydra vulgaris]
MVNRGGLPKEIISDNGTNFVGANKELQELVTSLNIEKIKHSTANKRVKWKFNHPIGRHFEGVHETMIKSAKKAIYSILGKADINDEELMTAFTGAESLIKYRPLTYQSCILNNNVPLTPNHFLYGRVRGEFAPENVDNKDFRINKRWRRIQNLSVTFGSDGCESGFPP